MTRIKLRQRIDFLLTKLTSTALNMGNNSSQSLDAQFRYYEQFGRFRDELKDILTLLLDKAEGDEFDV